MAQSQKTTKKFTAEDEAKIQAKMKELAESQAKAAQEAQLDAEARNRALDMQRKQPGYKYY